MEEEGPGWEPCPAACKEESIWSVKYNTVILLFTIFNAGGQQQCLQMKFLKRSQVLVSACSSHVHDAYAEKCNFLHAYIYNF